MNAARVIHLVADDVSVLLALRGELLPTIAHSGRRLAAPDGDLLASTRDAAWPGARPPLPAPRPPSRRRSIPGGWSRSGCAPSRRSARGRRTHRAHPCSLATCSRTWGSTCRPSTPSASWSSARWQWPD